MRLVFLSLFIVSSLCAQDEKFNIFDIKIEGTQSNKASTSRSEVIKRSETKTVAKCEPTSDQKATLPLSILNVFTSGSDFKIENLGDELYITTPELKGPEGCLDAIEPEVGRERPVLPDDKVVYYVRYQINAEKLKGKGGKEISGKTSVEKFVNCVASYGTTINDPTYYSRDKLGPLAVEADGAVYYPISPEIGKYSPAYGETGKTALCLGFEYLTPKKEKDLQVQVLTERSGFYAELHQACINGTIAERRRLVERFQDTDYSSLGIQGAELAKLQNAVSEIEREIVVAETKAFAAELKRVAANNRDGKKLTEALQEIDWDGKKDLLSRFESQVLSPLKEDLKKAYIAFKNAERGEPKSKALSRIKELHKELTDYAGPNFFFNNGQAGARGNIETIIELAANDSADDVAQQAFALKAELKLLLPQRNSLPSYQPSLTLKSLKESSRLVGFDRTDRDLEGAINRYERESSQRGRRLRTHLVREGKLQDAREGIATNYSLQFARRAQQESSIVNRIREQAFGTPRECLQQQQQSRFFTTQGPTRECRRALEERQRRMQDPRYVRGLQESMRYYSQKAQFYQSEAQSFAEAESVFRNSQGPNAQRNSSDPFFGLYSDSNGNSLFDSYFSLDPQVARQNFGNDPELGRFSRFGLENPSVIQNNNQQRQNQPYFNRFQGQNAYASGGGSRLPGQNNNTYFRQQPGSFNPSYQNLLGQQGFINPELYNSSYQGNDYLRFTDPNSYNRINCDPRYQSCF